MEVENLQKRDWKRIKNRRKTKKSKNQEYGDAYEDFATLAFDNIIEAQQSLEEDLLEYDSFDDFDPKYTGFDLKQDVVIKDQIQQEKGK